MASPVTFGPRALQPLGSDGPRRRACCIQQCLPRTGWQRIPVERQLRRMFGEHFSLRVGIEGLEFYDLCDCKSFFFVVPVTSSALAFPVAHKLEIGLGATTWIGSTDNSGYKPAPIIWATGIVGHRNAPKH